MNESNVTNIEDITDLRRKRKKKRNTQKFIGFMAIMVIALGLYVSRDRWMPKMNGGNNVLTDDEISNGNFPLKITNGVDYQSCQLGKGIALLSDTRLYIYSVDGELIDTRTNTYPNTILKYGGKRALMYEQSGYNFKIESRGRTIYEKQTKNQIIQASISEKGYVAVVTMSDRYVCELTVYDADGDEVYFRGCVERIMDISFNHDSTGCYITSVGASEGQIVSITTAVSFSSQENLWKSDELGTCCISSYSTEDNGLFVFGDTACAYYNNEGTRELEYKYASSLIDASFRSGKAAVLFESKERRKNTLVMFANHDKDAVEVQINKSVKSIYAEEKAVYVMTDSAIDAYSYSGKLIKSKQISDTYRQFYKIDNYIMLLGYNKIDRIEFDLK